MRLNGGALIYPPLDHWIWLIPAFLIGSCIGSFLNVVIYRVPLGMSVNDPKRSFCPKCKKAIPMWLNLPMVSWLWLRGKCAECKEPIAFRYFGVELLTAVLFAAVWYFFPPQVVVFLWVMMAILISVTFIDAEHLIIPTGMTWAGSVIGLGACAVWPQLPVMAGDPGDWLSGLMHGGIGWVSGFVGLWLVVELGKMAFGRKAIKFEKPVDWCLKEPTNDLEPMCFVIDGEEIPWWDLFCRKSDKLLVESNDIRVDGESFGGGKLTIREMEVDLPDGSVRHLSKMKSLDGTATAVVIPREAMGIGDVHLLGMIGAFFGWTGVLFALFSASIYAIIAAIIGRIGFGKQLPFGPFLAMGAVTWAFGGWKIWEWYLDFLGPLWIP
jgi:leader peptidase (prepilin peptidase)/N-methyltransferase